MKYSSRFTRALCCLVLTNSLALAQQGTKAPWSLDRVLDTLSAVHGFGQAAISPGGRRVAYIEGLSDKKGGPISHTAIFVTDLRSPGSRTRIAGKAGEKAHYGHLAWSPDGRKLAYLCDREKPGQFQIYLSGLDGRPPRRVTNLSGFVAHLHWSPDGKQLSFLFIENASRAAGPTQAAARETGVIEESAEEQRLVLLDLSSGELHPITPADLYIYEYEWSPDGKQLTATAAHGSGDNNWYIAQLYTIDAATKSMKSIYKPPLQIAEPHWSPDGRTIAFIAGLMSDEGATGGEIYTIPAAGGEPKNITPGIQASPHWLTWLPSGAEILFSEIIDGESGLAKISLSDGKVAQLWKGPETIVSEGGRLSVSLARDGNTSALVRQSYHRPPEIWAGPIGSWKQITHANENVRGPILGEAKSIHWQSDSFTVQGWLLYPRDFDPAKKYPLLVAVHGGPAWARLPAWPAVSFDLSLLSPEGYFVLFPNPRGSYGQGERFTQANVKDFGYGDFRDIMAGVDEVLRTAPVDKNRCGIAGWSYGGFMTMWAVTQTNRFRAAVAGAGICNWQSYYGENGIDQWMIPYFGASVYDDPAVYAKSSPITFIKKVKTPTLVLVGERDVECPTPQSYEFWHALKTLGVKTQLVVYKDEGHSIANQEHRRDILRRTVKWMNENLKSP
jgi:dipeptidyl aminopeptidase/acylaminoacyl peptidase